MAMTYGFWSDLTRTQDLTVNSYIASHPYREEVAAPCDPIG